MHDAEKRSKIHKVTLRDQPWLSEQLLSPVISHALLEQQQ